MEKSKEIRIIPTKTQLFMFSAVTWNRHQIHFNKDQAEAEGFPDVAVQRGLLGNFLTRLMADWMGNQGQLERLQWKVTQSAFPGQELRCQGEIIEISEQNGVTRANCSLKILNPTGALVAAGEAKIIL